jgi:hypothetical protein
MIDPQPEEIYDPIVPYIVCEAYPDYKRPRTRIETRTVHKSQLNACLLKHLVDFVFDRIDVDKLKSAADVGEFWEEFYAEYYMDNYPWEARAFIDGEWKFLNISDEALFAALVAEKENNANREYCPYSDDDDNDTETC